MDLLIGTSNAGKLGEFQELLIGVDLRLLSLKDVGLGDMDVAEDATTLEENAALKVKAYSQASGLITVADDTGLYVDALDGRPGIYPARYGGPGLTPKDRRQKLLGELQGVPAEKRTARFVCVIAVANPQTAEVTHVRGVCEGHIALAEDESGGGFGYDPVFIPEGYNATFSSLPLDEKNRVSHRGRAASMMIPILRRMADEK
ncbi:MAG: RdgB/HAM1 family non-canonical purine NTP pyrophosphatase [Anaerolineaceae bacterium]|nr:RdgB/HAM1 family non-canonical purine NTP pyrophosphatase [Anaerolineaceae bacterium]